MDSSQNGGACLLRGDEIVVAIKEERLLRQKRSGHPLWKASLSINYCLDTAGIKPADLSAIATCSLNEASSHTQDVRLNSILRPVKNEISVFKVGHHLGHAIGAFATSGFSQSAILVIDGRGSLLEDVEEVEHKKLKHTYIDGNAIQPHSPLGEVASLYFINDEHIVPLEKHISPMYFQQKVGMPYFNSLGSLYGAVGVQLFGDMLDGAGKVMGLAPYGKPVIPMGEFFEIIDNEFYMKTNIPLRYTHSERWPSLHDEYKDLAASVQAAIEEAILYFVRRARQISDSDKLCYAGGVALNSVANERMKDRVNALVKLREGFRPFAPVILREKLTEWFETCDEKDESPYMLRVLRFREEVAKLVPAVRHVDSTGRVQTITREANGRLYQLLFRFYQQTGVPILLNTSFNTSGEPIVESPEDACCCLLFSGMDACVLENHLVVKRPEFSSPLDLYVSLIAERVLIDHPGKGYFTNSEDSYQWEPFTSFYSLPLDRSDEVDRVILRDYCHTPTLRIITSTPYGLVMHVTSITAFEILKRCNGKQTGWEILNELNILSNAECDERNFRRMLATLRRASVVNLHLSRR